MRTHRIPPTLSLCMIVKNEALYLARCLDSVQDMVDEIIIVDTGSTDNTVEIAQRYQATIVSHHWQHNFSLARNTSLAHATGDWILVLDADETLERMTSERLWQLISQTSADGIQCIVRSFMPPQSLLAYEDGVVTRLFRNHASYPRTR